ncbi:hypothetical protein SCALM49S_05178 [Streptomyces californicus]
MRPVPARRRGGPSTASTSRARRTWRRSAVQLDAPDRLVGPRAPRGALGGAERGGRLVIGGDPDPGIPEVPAGRPAARAVGPHHRATLPPPRRAVAGGRRTRRARIRGPAGSVSRLRGRRRRGPRPAPASRAGGAVRALAGSEAAGQPARVRPRTARAPGAGKTASAVTARVRRGRRALGSARPSSPPVTRAREAATAATGLGGPAVDGGQVGLLRAYGLGVGQLTVVGEHDDALRLGVEPADVEQPRLAVGHVVAEALAAVGVLHGGDDAGGLVEREEQVRLRGDGQAVDLDLVLVDVHAHALLDDDLTVDLDARLVDQLLAGTPRAHAGARRGPSAAARPPPRRPGGSWAA